MRLPPVKRALLSVSDKDGLIPFAQSLVACDIEILSTGGTCRALREAGIPVTEVSDYTGFPEIMGGRVKTLHPKIHGGILGKRNAHAPVAGEHGIQWIDLVVVNLYPFAETIAQHPEDFDAAIEHIDIGGPCMIRAAAKNMHDVCVVVEPSDYNHVAECIQNDGAVPTALRRSLAQKAFAHCAHYDTMISGYLAEKLDAPQHTSHLELSPISHLRYGENPHQNAVAYRLGNAQNTLLDAHQFQGKALSYNNLVDASAALQCLREFDETACVIVKHANPCGVACGENSADAYRKALAGDSKSAFGGIIALNRRCDAQTAEVIHEGFFEVLLAPEFSAEALAILSQKKNMRVIEIPKESPDHSTCYQHIEGLMLAQDVDHHRITTESLHCVTKHTPNAALIEELCFAWKVVKHVKSNAICVSEGKQTLGIGPGQVARVDAVNIALAKAGQHNNAVLASDAFFPFKDSIEAIAKAGIKAIIQPGGSIRDSEVIDACNRHGIAMLFTGIRCFNH